MWSCTSKKLGEGDTRTVEFDPHDRRWQTEDEDGHTGDEHRALPLVAVVDKVSNTQLDRGNHGCQGSEGKREEEHRRHDEWADRAPGGLRKDLRQRQERDGRRAPGHGSERVRVHGKDGREDRKPGDDGDAVVGQSHGKGVEDGVLVLSHVNGIGDAHAHAR